MINKKYLAEFIGTFFLVFVGNCAITIQAITLPSFENSKEAVPISLVFRIMFTCLQLFVIMSIRNQPKVENEYNHRGGNIMELVQILKALADGNRIRILNILRKGELCVGEIEHILGMTQSNASRHLNKLFNLKIITYEKKAQWVYYRVNEDIIKEYSFIKKIFDTELDNIQQCKQDTEKLLSYKQSGMTCEQLQECRVLSKGNES